MKSKMKLTQTAQLLELRLDVADKLVLLPHVGVELAHLARRLARPRRGLRGQVVGHLAALLQLRLGHLVVRAPRGRLVPVPVLRRRHAAAQPVYAAHHAWTAHRGAAHRERRQDRDDQPPQGHRKSENLRPNTRLARDSVAHNFSGGRRLRDAPPLPRHCRH